MGDLGEDGEFSEEELEGWEAFEDEDDPWCVYMCVVVGEWCPARLLGVDCLVPGLIDLDRPRIAYLSIQTPNSNREDGEDPFTEVKEGEDGKEVKEGEEEESSEFKDPLAQEFERTVRVLSFCVVLGAAQWMRT